jgi:hypothetical protein
MAAVSSWTVPIGLMSNSSTKSLATLGGRNPGRVGPSHIPLTPRSKSATAFLLVPGNVKGQRQLGVNRSNLHKPAKRLGVKDKPRFIE